jgi:uncharacterized membrane protein YfhO
VEAVVETSQPTLLVVAQTFYSPWRARIDGKPATLWRANGAYQAVEVPSGRHTVTLAYEDRGFMLGVVLSVMSLLTCAVLWRSGRKERVGNPETDDEQTSASECLEDRKAA